MSIRLKSPAEIQLLEEGGKLLAKVMAQVVKATQPGSQLKV